MDKIAKKKLIDMFKTFIKKIDNGYCDNLSTEQLDKLISGFELISEVEMSIKENKPNKSWKQFFR